MKRPTAGNLVKILSTRQLAIVKVVDYHVAVVDILEEKREAMYMFDNIEIINHDVTIKDTDSEEHKIVKRRYVEWIAGLPKNYKQDWTVDHIRIVADTLNKADKKDRSYLIIKLALDLHRTKGGVQWLYRRLFVKAGKGVTITKRIKIVIEDLGLLGG